MLWVVSKHSLAKDFVVNGKVQVSQLLILNIKSIVDIL